MTIPPIDFLLKKASHSICLIRIKSEKNNISGVGFLMKVLDSKFLVIADNLINENNINYCSELIIDGYNINLKLAGRLLKFFPKTIGITVIEIKNSDYYFENKLFLNYD